LALFGRRRPRSSSEPAPADGVELLIVGLGNPGRDYDGSRHNVGADAVRLLAARHGGSLRRDKKAQAEVDRVVIDGHSVVLAVPQTYMNESGRAVGPLLRWYVDGRPEDLVVVHDELDLEPGRVKVKAGGGLAGHNGLRSLKSHLHSEAFVRVRIGVGKPPSKERGADHVLRRVSERERDELDIAVQQAADAVEKIVTDGVEQAMNEVNQIR
jgi:PTH1 family peptidyl-tRNA hydrolase